jgi:hypothetical protein
LNAAGRAGRAGHAAAGFVLIIPDEIITTADSPDDRYGPLFRLIDDIFSKEDQCLDIGDPIEYLLDRIDALTTQSRFLRYFLTRLPVSEDTEDPRLAATRILGRSLAAYRARRRGESANFQRRLEGALNARRQLLGLPEEHLWLERLASTSGMPAARVRELDSALQAGAPTDDASVSDWVGWIFEWLSGDRLLLPDLIDNRVIAYALRPRERQFLASGQLSSYLPQIRARVELWMSGGTLKELEKDLTPKYREKQKCKAARTFVTTFVNEFSYLAGTVAQIRRGRMRKEANEAQLALSLAVLGGCVREGLDTPHKLAVRYEVDAFQSRRSCHRRAEQLLGQRLEIPLHRNFADIRSDVRAALVAEQHGA